MRLPTSLLATLFLSAVTVQRVEQISLYGTAHAGVMAPLYKALTLSETPDPIEQLKADYCTGRKCGTLPPPKSCIADNMEDIKACFQVSWAGLEVMREQDRVMDAAKNVDERVQMYCIKRECAK